MTTFDAPFFRVPRSRAETSQGPVELPILYGRVDAAYAFFRVDADAVTPLLADTGLQPLPYRGVRCLLGVGCFAYHETTVGPYHEVGLAVFVAPLGQAVPLGGLPEHLRTLSRPEDRRSGLHILHLPVTTAIADAGGRELWGYPKFVTDIEMTLQDRALSCHVADPDTDDEILRLRGTFGVGLPAPALSLALYSVRDDELLRATVDVRGRMRAHGGGGLRLAVGASQHPMAGTLRTLGLDGTAPLAVFETRGFQSRLNAGVSVGSARHLAAA